MATHKFRIGEKVSWSAASLGQARSKGVVTIVAQMPPLGNDLQYRIRSAKDSHDHVVVEADLTREMAQDAHAATFR